MSAVVALLFYLFCSIEAAIISPTNTIGETEFYDTSTDSEFYGDQITCSTATCHVICDNTNGCKNMDIDASASTTLILECTQEQACDSLAVNADHTPNINITCSNQTLSTASSSTASCDSIQVNARNANSVQFYSNYYNAYNAKIYVTNADVATFHFEEYRAGYSADIFAEDVQTQLNIFCDGTEACYSMQIYTSNMQQTSNVFISCQGSKACQADIDAGTMAADLTVDCGGAIEQPCYLFGINALDMTGTFTLNCLTTRSCSTINAQCPMKCNVNCNTVNYACQDARLWIADRFVPLDTLNVDCGAFTESCQSVDINCVDNGGKGSLMYDDVNQEWVCQRHGCCPWERTNITCPTGADCQIDCAAQNCIGYILDARQATSLTLGCTGGTAYGGSYTCEGLHILAPLTDDASVILNCGDTWACIAAKVITGNNPLDNVEFNCGAGTSTGGCSKMTVELNAVSVNNVLFSCDHNTRYLCRYMNVMAVSDIANVSMNCGYERACEYSNFVFTGLIDSFSMDCSARSACISLHIEARIANDNLMLNCIGEMACRELDLNINSTTSNAMYDIKCNNPTPAPSNTYGACYFAIFRIYADEAMTSTFQIDCDSTYDCYYADFYMYDLNTVDINCKGQQSCKYFAYVGSSQHVNVNCSNQLSCTNGDIDCPYDSENACNIYCSPDGNSCDTLEIKVPSDYTYNYLNLNCDANDVNGVDTANTCLNLKVNCITTPKSDINYIYDAVNNGYICDNVGSSYCCPYIPTASPTKNPTVSPTTTASPTGNPSKSPTNVPTETTDMPSKAPSKNPSKSPTNVPSDTTVMPSVAPSKAPTDTYKPSEAPSKSPSEADMPNTIASESPTGIPTTAPLDTSVNYAHKSDLYSVIILISIVLWIQFV